MAKHIALLSFICLLLSCSDHNKPDYASLIKGDWLGQKTSEGFEHDQTEFLSFEDSVCRTPYTFDAIKYEIEKDTLYLLSEEDKARGRNKFTIVKLTADSLVLLSGKKQQNTIKYSKIHSHNNITPTTIYFADPKRYLEIDSNRNIRVYDLGQSEINTGYKGTLDKDVYNSILNKVRNLPVDSLKENYAASLCCNGFSFAVAIKHGNTITRSIACGNDQEPNELHLLFAQLLHLPREVSLQPDSSVNWENYALAPFYTDSVIMMPPKIVK
ncbi:hypothetical protein [Niastella sp. OAS944]|uniref:hypothetical protein n=1 Tax=Niastella sp. OAS944 TaxID=2664089 RepID=UPI003485DDBC|nr:hypothetical protein [Chitinophagaceae bacterium OAS944]